MNEELTDKEFENEAARIFNENSNYILPGFGIQGVIEILKAGARIQRELDWLSEIQDTFCLANLDEAREMWIKMQEFNAKYPPGSKRSKSPGELIAGKLAGELTEYEQKQLDEILNPEQKEKILNHDAGEVAKYLKELEEKDKFVIFVSDCCGEPVNYAEGKNAYSCIGCNKFCKRITK